MAAPVTESGDAKNITATASICTENCTLLGFYVNSTVAGTLVIRRGVGGSSSGTAISGTITPAVGFHPFPADCPGGAHATVGGTLDVTFFFN